MESWPDDPEEGILVSALRMMLPPKLDNIYPGGTYLMQRGDPCLGFYRVERGTVELEYFEEGDADSDLERDEV